jgi:hypothetical protein
MTKFDEFAKNQKIEKIHAEPSTKLDSGLVQHPCLSAAGNKIKDFETPKSVDPEINSGPDSGR